MPITQIPFQDPVAPPEKPQPEQLGLYDTEDWETAYRELDERVPHLLIQLQDDLERSRKREAAWISVIVHLLLFIVLWNLNLIEKYIPWHRAVVVATSPTKDKNMTFLTLPPDLQRPARRPKTDIASDKDRIAMARHPDLDSKIPAAPPPGRPGPRGSRAAQAPPQQQAMPQNQPQMQPPAQQQQQAATRPQFETNQTAQLQPPPSNKNVFSKYATQMSAGSAIQQATQAAAASRGGGQEGDFGIGRGAKGRQIGPVDILSDTQGVDFGPYLQRLIQEVKEHWYQLIPESAEMKRGKLRLEFAIMKDGRVAGLKLVQSSGDIALDRPAIGSITGSDPFPPLPNEFNGQYLTLRFTYFYLANNPDPTDLQ